MFKVVVFVIVVACVVVVSALALVGVLLDVAAEGRC